MGDSRAWRCARRAGRRAWAGLAAVLRFGLSAGQPRHLLIGRYGEWLARRHLRRMGCQVVAVRCRTAAGEIDIAAWDGQLLCVIEVKTRVGRGASPESAWTAQKRERVTNAARTFLAERRLNHVLWRIDLVTVRLCGWRRVEIDWRKNAAPGAGRRR